MAEKLSEATKALSIQQPWAWLIVNGHKDVENRSWPTSFRGLVYIHAGKKLDKDTWIHEKFGARPEDLERGGIVGIAEIVDCVRGYNSPWWSGPYGFVIKNARPLPFVPMLGALGFFDIAGRALLEGNDNG